MMYLTFCVYFSHLFACLLIFIGDKQQIVDQNERPWLIKNADFFGTMDKFSIYVFTIYWTFETLSTVGYGDFSGSTRLEYQLTMML